MPAAAASVAPEVGVGVTMAAPDVSPSMAAELTTAVAASPEFGEVSDGDVVR
jgi:hypothetical protein